MQDGYMNKLFLFAGSVLLSSGVMAQNPLSVHVLNLENGLPSAEVKVTLEEQNNGKWTQIAEAKTNEQGRVTALFPENRSFNNKIYKVTFKTGDWFKQNKQTSFFPEVPVIFQTDGSVKHYHIPLLISPYGYSTYRGN